MPNGDEASSSIILAGQALLVKMLRVLELHGIFASSFVYYCILTLCSCWYAKRGEASPSIILAGQALLVKIQITLELCGTFGSKFLYLYT